MDSVRHPAEASFSRSRDAIMEERYRRLQYDPSGAAQFWGPSPKAMALGRFKRHLPAIPKKKGKDSTRKTEHFDIPAYPKHYKDKYGSVSAHSTSAIYGALRAPHYHAIYGPTDMWYASVRSLNRGLHRDVVYTAETYEWRETLYEESAKEVFAVGPQVEMIPRPACMCMVRRRHLHEGSPASKSRPPPRCKICAPAVSSNGSSNNGQSSSKRTSGIPEKIKQTIITDEKAEPKLESTSRMSGYKKCITGSKYKSSAFKGLGTKESQRISRKSILECDVTAYDLIKKVSKTPSTSEIDDSDIDDNLSDNIIAKANRTRTLKKFEDESKMTQPSNGSPRQISSKKHSSKFKKSQSENCIYSESHSVLVGGQRIFTDNHRSKSPNLSANLNSGDEQEDLNQDSGPSKWRKLSASDESVCIPDPDYDFSDDSDDSTVINSNCMDPKFTYSPPPIRKSMNDPHHGLGYSSRELSKSMSSLQSDDTFVPCITADKPNSTKWVAKMHDCDIFENDFVRNSPPKDDESDEDTQYEELSASSSNALYSKQDSKYESSSDCSSNGGTMSSDYPTWTSSSSNELKSILKNKRRREHAIKELEDVSRTLQSLEDSKDYQKKKQVQFRPGCSNTFIKSANDDDGGEENNESVKNNKSKGNFANDKPTSVINDTYETLAEATSDKTVCNNDVSEEPVDSTKGSYVSINNPFAVEDSLHSLPDGCSQEKYNLPLTSIKDDFCSDLKLIQPVPDFKQTSLLPTLPPKLPPGRSSSLEDIRDGHPRGRVDPLGEKKNGGRRRRTTLPKRRFSDLHLHLLLCPTRSSFCGNGGSSSDDMPLTVTTQRAHRSLPDSPSELDEVPSFCFDFLEKNSKDKVLSPSRSVFYVPVDGTTPQKADVKDNSSISNVNPNFTECTQLTGVSPSTDENSHQLLSKDEQVDISDMDGNLSPEQYDTDEDNLENDYENLDPIYEELSEVSNSSKRLISSECEPKSFFEGASKTDILSYLADAKERGLSTEGLSEDEKIIMEEEEDEDEKVLSDEDAGEKNRVITNNSINHKEVLLKIEEGIEKEENVESENTGASVSKSTRISEVERNDSGVGTETSKPPRMKLLPADWEEQLCADCDHQVEPQEDEDSGLLFSPLVCRKCEFRRSERKEIIIEFVDTELKYGRDLRIIKDEFYRPMEIAGLLAKDQLQSIFLNLEELTSVNTKFSEKLQDALDIAMEHGDEDYTTVNIGKIFLETSSMLHAFETYCVKQASASVLLSSLEKEKELLRIFLRVSQMENTLLRRMNLPAFLMVPVQRVTRYPLLLSRLHKVTPIHHKDRNALKEAQQKVELHLEHINQQTKGVGGTKIWRRISNISASHRRLGKDIGSIKLRKMALEVLNWKQDEARFVIAGKLLFTQITDYPWNKKGKTVKFSPLHALLIALGKPNSNYRPENVTSDNAVLFPRNTGIRDASLVLMKEKNGRFIIVRDPLYLGNCVISCEPETDDVFEIQEYTTKEAYLLKGETKKDTKEWLRQLRYHAKDLGSWRKRRNALANIMINGMIRQ